MIWTVHKSASHMSITIAQIWAILASNVKVALVILVMQFSFLKLWARCDIPLAVNNCHIALLVPKIVFVGSSSSSSEPRCWNTRNSNQKLNSFD